MSLLTGPAAVSLWHVLRFGAYGIVCQIIIKSAILSYAQTSYLVSALRDDRLKAMRESMSQRKGATERTRLPASNSGPAGPEQTASSPDAPQTDFSAPQARRQPRWTQQAPEPQATPQANDDSYLFDDASPVAPSERQAPPPGSRQSAGDGSAWDRIRQRAKSEEGARWNPPGRQGDTAADQRSTDQYTYTQADQEKAYAKEQAQKEFDAMLERERRGVGDSGGRK